MNQEAKRQQLQAKLDSRKTKEERNRMGQFSTPYPLALDIMSYAKRLMDNTSVSLLEPSIGTGVFFSALTECFSKSSRAVGFEIDPYYFQPTKDLWNGYAIDLRNEDFLTAQPFNERFSLLVANPPYSRHHHIPTDIKKILKAQIKKDTGLSISGLSSLYCYFLILSTKWLADDALSCWLLPSEFMDVNYGEAVKEYLTTRVNLVAIHRFSPSDVQFNDALVSSSIVVFRNSKPNDGKVRLSTGGTICSPKIAKEMSCRQMKATDKWSAYFGEREKQKSQNTIGDYFTVKRGIATGNNHFFIIDKSVIDHYSIPSQFLTPVLPAPRNLSVNEVRSQDGQPLLDHRLFLFSCNLEADKLRKMYPNVYSYIEEGERSGVANGANCSKRSPWYSCEVRKPSPILITYMGRNVLNGNLFRFILNNSEAIATNSYLMLYPKSQYTKKFHDETVRRKVWEALNDIPKELLMNCGRVYGGGLYKLEPHELLKAPIDGLDGILGREPTLFNYA